MKKLISLLLALSCLPVYAAEVNVYSARKEKLIKPLLDQFTERTGIKVNLVTGKADALLSRLKSEGKLTPADLLITTDAGRLHRAKQAGLLQKLDSTEIKQVVPAAYRDKDQQWVGLSVRSRPIMYSKSRFKPEQLSTYEALAKPELKGKICIRSSNNIYNQSLVASMLKARGEQKTQAWAKGLVSNFARPPKGGDRDQIKAVANGICDVAVANTYYLGGMLSSKDPAQVAAAKKVAVFWPNQQGRGAHVNVSGAGIIKTAKNKREAEQLISFLLSKPAQQWYAKANHEYPVRADVKASELLQSWGEFKADGVNLSYLGELNGAAVKVMDKAGWR